MLKRARRDDWGSVSSTRIAMGGMASRLRQIRPDGILEQDDLLQANEIVARLVRIEIEISRLRDEWTRANADPSRGECIADDLIGLS